MYLLIDLGPIYSLKYFLVEVVVVFGKKERKKT